MNIGERIINEAEKQGLNQKQLAAGIEVSETSIGKWKVKNQDIKFQNVVRASEFLNVSLDYLAYGTENTRLSPIEQELIDSFRKLSPNEQQRIIGRCEEIVSSKDDIETEIIEIAARSKKGDVPKISTNEFWYIKIKDMENKYGIFTSKN